VASAAGGELRIDYVSPLPPVRSGIADYSTDLLPELGRRCDLRLVRLPGQPVAAEVADRYPLVEPERLGEGGRLPLYQMGNNHHHLGVWELATAHPGVLTLHDVVLHHFLIDRTVKEGDFEGYRRQLAADHGWIGDAAAAPMRWPGGSGAAAQFALPAHRTLLLRQRGVLVHSRWAAGWLAEEVPAAAVRPVPMGIPLGPRADAAAGRELRRRHGIPADRPLLGSFGFQTPMKRTEAVIRALAAPELAGAHLMVAGETAPILRLDAVAEAAGVASRVHFLGFLPFAELEAAIAACDLCLNLRYPTAGETSASLLRILAVGRPAVVSDYAQSAELPDAGVVKIPVGEGEERALRERLAELLAEPERLREMGEAARRHVEVHHRPADAAAAMVEACRELGDREPPGDATPEPPPPTSLLGRRLAGEITVTGAERPWPPGTRRRVSIRARNRGPARWLAGERPDGGVAFEVSLEGSGDHRTTEGRWIALPADLDPGGEHRFELHLRRPLGPARLRVVPHVFGPGDFTDLEVPVWEVEV